MTTFRALQFNRDPAASADVIDCPVDEPAGVQLPPLSTASWARVHARHDPRRLTRHRKEKRPGWRSRSASLLQAGLMPSGLVRQRTRWPALWLATPAFRQGPEHAQRIRSRRLDQGTAFSGLAAASGYGPREPFAGSRLARRSHARSHLLARAGRRPHACVHRMEGPADALS